MAEVLEPALQKKAIFFPKQQIGKLKLKYLKQYTEYKLFLFGC